MNVDTKTLQRFMAKVNKTEGCWLWTGATTKGYGQLAVAKRHGYAHRFMWEWHHGPIPSGSVVMHRCDVPLCVNPAHLSLGTMLDNNRDCIAKGRRVNHQLKGRANPAAKVDETAVLAIRKRFAAGEPAYRIARDFGIGKSQAWNIANHRSWRHLDGV